MTRSKVQLQRITDDKSRQAMFAKRKQGLFKKAMELSVLCDCDVALIIFGPGSSGPGTGGQRLYQYSSVSMDELLERYATAVAEPHERRRNGELLRHYYELSPDEDGFDEEVGREGDGGACSSAVAAAAAATMAAVDSIILGGGGRRQDVREGGPSLAKRMRTHSPGLGGGLPGLPGQGASPQMGGLTQMGGMTGGGVGNGTTPPAMTPLRRVPMMGGGGLGSGLPLEGIRAAGFLDKRNYPVSPRSEKAYEEITAEFDKLTELRSQRAKDGGVQNTPTVLQPLSSSSAGAAGFSLAAQQQHLQRLLQQQKQQQQQQGGAAKRFKPLSILVPEIRTHPIIPTNLTPFTSAAAGAPQSSPSTAAAAPELRSAAAGDPGDRSLQQQQQQQHSQSQYNNTLSPQQQQQLQQQQQNAHQQAGLPPRPPVGRQARPHSLSGTGPPSGQPQGAVVMATCGSRMPGGAAAISPTTAAPGSLHGGNGAADGVAAMDAEGGGGTFAFDRRSGGTLSGGEDALGGLMGSSAFRTSLDGSTANLLSIPSPPPHGGAHSLFGSLDGGPLSIRSSSHGMLASLSLDRGTSLGLSGMGLGLESPGGTMGLDSTLRGLAPMDVLDWPSTSPRSSAGNGDGSGGGGGFPDEGEGGTEVDGLIVRGTALSKLAPEALEAAIGASPDVSGGGTPVPARGRGGGAASTSGAFAAASTGTVGAEGQQQLKGEPASGQQCPAGRLGGEGADVSAGSHLKPPRTGTESEPGRNRQDSGIGMFMAAAEGLTSELSFNELHFGLQSAAAAAVAAVQRDQEQGQGASLPPDGGDLDLQVVGRALALPGGARGGAPEGSGAAGASGPIKDDDPEAP